MYPHIACTYDAGIQSCVNFGSLLDSIRIIGGIMELTKLLIDTFVRRTILQNIVVPSCHSLFYHKRDNGDSEKITSRVGLERRGVILYKLKASP